jgi:hypothetical protein
MTLSYSDVFAISHERDNDEIIRIGDIVRTGPNLHPHFEVIALSGDRAWVRNVVTGADSLAWVARCRLLPMPAVAIAAE